MTSKGFIVTFIICIVLLCLSLPCVGQSEPIRMTFLAIAQFESENSPLYQCHLSAPDESAQVISFRRVSTRNGDSNNNPPPAAFFNTDQAFHHWRIELNNKNNNDAFGVFGCRASLPGKLETDISGIFMRSDADVIPDGELFTKTVNVGDTDVTITMKTSGSKAVNEFRWLKDNLRNNDMDGLDTWNISGPVTVNDAGVYECHIDNERNQARQGLMLLIVRACEANKWGPPDCTKDCTHCYNGGICNENTGDCICAPGFAGTNCENACGGNRHGYSCNDNRCSNNPSDKKHVCGTFLFCLPHPFGCRCNTGWKGLACNEVCDRGTYGASCLQTCNCKSKACDRYTGECTGSPGGCSDGWTGSNCQQVCPAPQFGFDCVEECNCQNATCDHIIGCTSSCNPGWAYLSSANCRIGIIDNGYTRQNPKITFPVTCTINKDNDDSHEQLDLVLSRQEIILDDSGITVNETNDNATARTILFMVDGVSDGTSLYCQLRKNDSRRAVLEVPIDLYDLPVLQSAPTKEFVDKSSVTISWVPWNEENDQGDSPVVGYIPYYFHHSAVDWINGSYVAASDNLTFTISDLDPDTRYVFSVAAVREGDGGEGPKSPNITVKTICAAPVRGPTDVEAFISGDRQELVKISWKNPSVEDINCDAGVSKYTVYYSSGDMLSSAYETREIFSPIDGTSVTLEDLVAGNTYNFQVTLTTEGGESSWNNPVDHLIPILPSLRNPPKVNYSCGHKVTITWNGWTEDEDDGTPPVIGYIPYHKLATTKQWIPSSLVHHEGDKLPMSYTFTDLSVSVGYNFALSVVREGHGGEGDMGEIVAYTTIHCEPGLPTGIIIGSISGGLLLLLLLLFVISLIKKRRSPERRPCGEKRNVKAVEDLKLDQMNEYENTGISNKEDEEYDKNGSLYEMPSVNLNSDDVRPNSCKEFRMCNADYKGESNSVPDYEDI